MAHPPSPPKRPMIPLLPQLPESPLPFQAGVLVSGCPQPSIRVFRLQEPTSGPWTNPEPNIDPIDFLSLHTAARSKTAHALPRHMRAEAKAWDSEVLELTFKPRRPAWDVPGVCREQPWPGPQPRHGPCREEVAVAAHAQVEPWCRATPIRFPCLRSKNALDSTCLQKMRFFHTQAIWCSCVTCCGPMLQFSWLMLNASSHWHHLGASCK